MNCWIHLIAILQVVITDFILSSYFWDQNGSSGRTPKILGSHGRISAGFVSMFKHIMMIRFEQKNLMLQFF